MPERIDYDQRGNLDVSVTDVQLFQLEYMDNNRVCVRLHRDAGQDVVIWLTSREKIIGSVERI